MSSRDPPMSYFSVLWLQSQTTTLSVLGIEVRSSYNRTGYPQSILRLSSKYGLTFFPTFILVPCYQWGHEYHLRCSVRYPYNNHKVRVCFHYKITAVQFTLSLTQCLLQQFRSSLLLNIFSKVNYRSIKLLLKFHFAMIFPL